MTSSPRTQTQPVAPRRYGVVVAIIVICCLIELALSASDLGVIEYPSLRRIAYEYAGFWPGLLGNWVPNYAAQPFTMFATYGVLHGGPGHLLVNMITLWSLGRAVTDRVGTRGFLQLYLCAMVGGAMGFGLLSSSLTPMVGASGALFGLAGGYLAWTYVDLYALQDKLWPVVRAVLFLVALNLILWWAMDGLLAWETHLGGFVIGWVVALLIDPIPRDPDAADPDQL